MDVPAEDNVQDYCLAVTIILPKFACRSLIVNKELNSVVGRRRDVAVGEGNTCILFMRKERSHYGMLCTEHECVKVQKSFSNA